MLDDVADVDFADVMACGAFVALSGAVDGGSDEATTDEGNGGEG